MEKRTVIRKIYLYLFALLGLVLLTIGSVRFINMGLKAWVFTEAEKEQKFNYDRPREVPYYLDEKTEAIKTDDAKQVSIKLTEAQTIQLKSLLKNNEEWEKQKGEIDYIKAQRHRDASINLSLILVGLPLYLTHWFIIKRETKA
ncbi:hypothetical protein HQ571_06250 [Candidatus Kuenenbacteria bacterium]|nr:hypothetical protein [Candidatus Kuenenbacteria bacterium]